MDCEPTGMRILFGLVRNETGGIYNGDCLFFMEENMPTVNLAPGQSVTLTAQPTIAGNPGGVFINPVTWSHNGNLINVDAMLTPMNNGMNCVVAIPANETDFGSFTVTATSGALSAGCIVICVQPADGMQILVGQVQ